MARIKLNQASKEHSLDLKQQIYDPLGNHSRREMTVMETSLQQESLIQHESPMLHESPMQQRSKANLSKN